MSQKTNAIIDLFAFLTGLISLISGLVLMIALPAGQKSGKLSFWIFTRFQWLDIHAYVSLILVGIILIHLIVHWQWIKTTPELFSNGIKK